MPEKVKDRPTRSHEYVFLLAHPDGKGQYYYDYEASREPTADGRGKRNRRTVWTVNPKPYQGSHFAVWPEELVRPMIAAGSSEHGVCATCGAPFVRVAEPEGVDDRPPGENPARKGLKSYQAPLSLVTLGWEKTCGCKGEGDPAPATVLDVFSGSGTTGKVALGMGRSYIGLDLNPAYLPLAEARIQGRKPPKAPPAPQEGDDLGDLLTAVRKGSA